MRGFARAWILGALLVAVVAVGCASDDDADNGATDAPTPGATGGITVSAAASLTQAFTKIGADFKKANPDATVAFNFGSSATLATQIRQGAPADTFASADEDDMKRLVTADLVDGTPVVFATNNLVIVTKPGNPKKVKTLADLPNAGIVSLCNTTVPCGRYAGQILQGAGVTIPESRITRGTDVKVTLGAVTTGDADAAIVYATDARSAGAAVETVVIPDAQNAIAVYPIATIKASGNRATSQAFLDYVTSAAGEATLKSFGFLPPT